MVRAKNNCGVTYRLQILALFISSDCTTVPPGGTLEWSGPDWNTYERTAVC
ncbi:hypothetical protein AB0K16_45200 [Nonomuraea jabiensis]|uniref:hypothetical protein n=1 Tax=Nonomuraea jabiensis TaxID=882448 RepID=UPI003434B511